jgi:hypothetical protein
MLNKNSFDTLFLLTKRQPWLVYKANEVQNLMTVDCKNKDEQNLVLDLLTRFKYLTSDDFSNAINQIVSRIVGDVSYDQSNTMIVATTMDSSPDSAQYVLYQMKPVFQEKGWDKPKLINIANKIIRDFPRYRNVIFVDEFIGSGKTVLGRVNNLKRELRGNGYKDYSIRIYSIAASTVGKARLISEGIDLVCDLVIPMGISEHYKENKEEKIKLMLQIEDILSKEYESKAMPSLGHERVEALYARQNGNTPNNVFPVFWWPFYITGAKRPTVLVRSMGDA